MNNIENNYKQFINQYDFTKRNYNIIIHSPNATGKYKFITYMIKNYYALNNLKYSTDLLANPDIFYLSLPLIDRSGKFERNITNDERLLYEFGFEDKFDNCRVGNDISIDQIRDLRDFTNLSPKDKHKIIIINNCNYLNNQSSAALLKTLEETNSPCIFLLLTSEIELLKDTIKSRCHSFQYQYDMNQKNVDTFFNFFISIKPGLQDIYQEYGYLEDFHLFEDELFKLYNNEINPLELSNIWMERGHLCIDYLLSLFYLLMKGFKLDSSNNMKTLYNSLFDKIPIDSNRAIVIIRILYKFKIDSRSNLNKKLFFDNLLIVLNKELY